MHRVTKLQETSLADRARAEIQRAILDGVFGPDERIPIERIAEELGVSRTPVREALKALEGDGLVSLHPNRGAVVKRVPNDELDRRYKIRAMVEGYAAELACEADHAQLAEVLAANCEKAKQVVKGKRATTASGIRTLVKLNLEFHDAICTASSSPTVRSVLDRVQNPNSFSSFFWSDPKRQRISLGHHEGIAAAIAAGDAALARRLMEEHILGATSQITAGTED